MKNVLAEVRNNHDRYLEEMKELLRIPSISPGTPHPEAITAAAKWIEDRLKKAGMDDVEQLVAEGHNPVVIGRKQISDELPTVLFYGHYDVMPPEPLELWETPPFEPTVKDGMLIGRGTADDKGQALMHLFAVEAYLKVKGTLPVNAIFCLEGEEEMGSEGLEKLLDSHKDKFKADVAVVSDSPFFAKGCPSLCYGLRGIAAAEIKVYGPGRDLHSGNYGGSVANPLEILARILNDLKDRDGRITVDGFYDDVVELTPAERENYAALPFSDDDFAKELNVPKVDGEKGFTTLERIWARPTLDLNGIGGGFQDPGSKTIVPSDAFAKVTMRLVPNQDPVKVLEAFKKKVMEVAPDTVRVEVEKGHVGYPFLAPIDNDHVKAGERAIAKGFGDKTYFIRDGASIPIVNSIAQKLGATCLLIGVDVPEGKIHSPNEMIILDNFYKGIETIVYLLEEL